jgi:L-histidine N-alpha-methyltransferase
VSDVRLDRHLTSEDLAAALRDDVRRGLSSTPKTLPPKYFYDARGSELFEEITRLPEYYPTRAERRILVDRAAEIADLSKARTLVELGSGSSEKTHLLLRALADVGTLETYVPFDVSAAAIEGALPGLRAAHPHVEVHGVVGDFERHLDRVPGSGPRLVAFLGGTIGNFEPVQRAGFLAALASTMAPGDALLLGTDLVKDPARLVAAYDDAAGVTAEFNRNVLRVVNRELGADFDVDRFEHVAVWDDRREWIEMRLRSTVDQRVEISSLGMVVRFAAGEELRTEISAKFRAAGLSRELAAAGLHLTGWWTDPAGDFALSMAMP